MSAVMKEQLNLLPDEDEAKWQAALSKDATLDGQFVFAVSSTKIYCRPSCPSRRPKRERVSFFRFPEAAEQAGFRACLRCHPRNPTDPHVELARRICKLLDDGDVETTTLAALSAQTGVSSFHLQRTFKKVMGVTPRQYAESARVKRFKGGTQAGKSISTAMYDAGFGSSSRLYESAGSQLGMTPATYGKGGQGAIINYAIVECSLGSLLVAATSKGVCSVKLGDTATGLEVDLKREFSAAQFQRDENRLSKAVRAVVEFWKGSRRISIFHSTFALRHFNARSGSNCERFLREKLLPTATSQGDRSGESSTRGGARLRHESGSTRNSLSPRNSRRQESSVVIVGDLSGRRNYWKRRKPARSKLGPTSFSLSMRGATNCEV